MASDKEMQQRSAWLVVLLLTVILALAVAACGSEGQASLEEQARSIDKSLMCPVCAGQTIEQSASQLARQMQALVREKLAEGWSEEQIRQFFMDRYGEGVLAAPPKEGVNLVAWVIPPTAVAVAAVLLAFVIRAMRKGQTRAEPETLAENELEPYLSAVDRDLEHLTKPQRHKEHNRNG